MRGCSPSRTHTHKHTCTHSHRVLIWLAQERNSVIRMSRSLDMNPKTVGSVQSNQVIKLIIWEELYSKTYYLPGVKWLSGPQRPDGLVWLGRGGWREEWLGERERDEDERGDSRMGEDGRPEVRLRGENRRMERRSRKRRRTGEGDSYLWAITPLRFVTKSCINIRTS